MAVKLKFFAMLKGLIGREEAELEIPGEISMAELKTIIKREYPVLADLIDKRGVLVSVNQEFAGNEMTIKDGDEVAFLPPFSGG
ncbi:MAG: MoaD/ThiS family protein [Thermodesulfobacteriota bacterium]